MSIEDACKITRYDDEMPTRDRVQISFGDVSGDILENVNSLKARYDEELLRAKDKYLTNPKASKNKECFYNGLLKRELKSNKLSYYICRCDQGYMGDNCQISKDLYYQTQKQIIEALNNIQKKLVQNDKKSKHIFLQALTIINKFKLSRQIVEQIYTMIETFITKFRDAENRKKLYSIYDGILLNAFDLIEDIQKFPREEVFADSFLQQELDDIQLFILKVMDKLKVSLQDYQQDSLLLPDSNFQLHNLNTHSFILEEFNLGHPEAKQGFTIRNPNIDTSFHNLHPTKLWFETEGPVRKSAIDMKMRVINFSSPLLELALKAQKEIPISNLLHLHFMQPFINEGNIHYVPEKIKTFKIQFALNFLPAYENILDEVSCYGFLVSKRDRYVVGKPIEFSDETITLTCEFNVYFDMQQYYFGVSIKTS